MPSSAHRQRRRRTAAHQVTRRRIPALAFLAVLLVGAALGALAARAWPDRWSPTSPQADDGAVPDPVPTASGDRYGSGTYQTFWADNGIELRFHYDDHGLAPDGLAGSVVFFDGDGTRSFESPAQGRAAQLSDAAAAADRAFVFVDAPVRTSWTAGPTEVNAEAVRQLVGEFSGDRSVLLMGYSGGAEFLAGSLIREDSAWLPAGSGLVLVGGGGTYGQPVASPAGADPPQLTWVVGDEDGYGATDPEDWSALEASESAVAAYREAGYRGAERVVVPGDHGDYDFPALVDTYADALDG